VATSSRSVGGSAFLLSLCAFAYGGLCMYSAKHDLTLAKTEVMTSGQAYLHHQRKNSDIFDSLRCDYTFMVNLRPYSGYGICPAQTDHSVKGAIENLAGLLQNQKVTVYYDPADPTTNSMIEFGARSAYDNGKANLSILVGVVLLIVVGIIYVAGGNKASQQVAADSGETVVDPDKSESES
jgi:hypothetical protein